MLAHTLLGKSSLIPQEVAADICRMHIHISPLSGVQPSHTSSISHAKVQGCIQARVEKCPDIFLVLRLVPLSQCVILSSNLPATFQAHRLLCNWQDCYCGSRVLLGLEAVLMQHCLACLSFKTFAWASCTSPFPPFSQYALPGVARDLTRSTCRPSSGCHVAGRHSELPMAGFPG